MNMQLKMPDMVKIEVVAPHAATVIDQKKLFSCLVKAYKDLPIYKRGMIDDAAVTLIITAISYGSASVPELTRFTLLHPEVAECRIFHRANAAWMARKHDSEKFQFNHDESVTEEALKYYRAKFHIDPPAEAVKIWLLHDSWEDYHTRYNDIAAFAGKGTAQGVRRLSIPRLEDLQMLYPELAGDKAALKYKYKEESTKTYSVAEVILKFFDNKAGLKDFTSNMEQGQVTVTPHDHVLGGDSGIYTMRSMHERLCYRERSNKQLIERCRTIDGDPELNPQHIDCLSMIPDFERMFAGARKDFEVQLKKSVADYRAGISVRPNLLPPGLSLESDKFIL